MTTTQIQYFLEVANCESFSKAAEKLYISHQVLSSQIKALEKDLGIELLNRKNKRKISLTDAGQVMYEAWSEISDIYEKAYTQAKKLQEAENNSLVIGIQDMRFVRSYVVPLIRKLQEEPGGINLEYRLGKPTEMFPMLESGQVDMLIMISSDIHPENKYHSTILCRDALHLVAAMSKNHPLAKRKTLKLEDLKDETVLMIGADYSGEAARRFQADQEQGNVQIKKIKYYNSPRTINIAVETGVGVAILFDELLEEARNEIRTIPFKLPNAERTDMLLVWKDPRYAKIASRMTQL